LASLPKQKEAAARRWCNQLMDSTKRSPDRRAAIWAAVIAFALPFAFLGFVLIVGRFLGHPTWLGRVIEGPGSDVFIVFLFPGIFAGALYALLFSRSGIHGMSPYFFVLVPFINWAFHYYCVFRPIFRWLSRRAALKGT
jgi:hypothetical protein